MISWSDQMWFPDCPWTWFKLKTLSVISSVGVYVELKILKTILSGFQSLIKIVSHKIILKKKRLHF